MSDAAPHGVKLFDNPAGRRKASQLGMWIFLATEIMFFGGLFVAFFVYYFLHPQVFKEASQHLDVWLGAINTCVLLTSSLTVALAVHAAQEGHNKSIIRYLFLTLFLAFLFLVFKGIEYHHKFEAHLIPGTFFQFTDTMPQEAQLFFGLYFTMTGLHALHVLIGMGLFVVIGFMAYKNKFTKSSYGPVEMTGLYWHLVDIVWIFIFPFLYLIGRA